MSSVGTVRQLHQATGIPARTLHRWAQAGDLKPVDRVRAGRRWATRYDGRQAMRISVSRAAT